MLTSSSSSASSAFSSLCRSPCRTPLPPSLLLSHFYHSQALLYRSLDLLLFITTASSLAATSLVAVVAFKCAPSVDPPYCHRFTLLPLLPLLVVNISSKKESRHYLFFNYCFICLLP
ncbi:hypothetical protein BHE74_00005229 [Ensete ventricosum]|nr:hypothetical protein BHE74_00005229 [Ensete ventricosum]